MRCRKSISHIHNASFGNNENVQSFAQKDLTYEYMNTYTRMLNYTMFIFLFKYMM